MIELIKYFRILFMSPRISRDRLKSFCEDHIIRLTNNNPGGIFTTILTAVTAAYNAFYGDLSSMDVNRAVQEAKTEAMEASRQTLLKQLSDNEKLVSYTYRNDVGVYQEFYPLGITEYREATLANLETIGLRYKTVLANHAADFTPAFVTDYDTVYQTYVDNRTAQTAAMSSVAAERSDLTATRSTLATQLTHNVLTISLQYLGDESKAEVYFNQQILDDAFRASERRVVGEIDPGETHNIFEVTEADVRVVVRNTGTFDLFVNFESSPDQPVDLIEGRQLKPGEEDSGLAGEGGWTSVKRFLNVTNPPNATAGGYIGQKV